LALDDPLTVASIFVGVIIVCVVIVFSMRHRGGEEKKPSRETPEPELRGYPFKILRTIPQQEASQARDELRILDIEREILSDAIRRLYEAHAEGKITEEERERLAQTYKSRMMTVKDAISKDESLVALHELEAMQEDLMKLFSQRFDELSSKVEQLRSKTDVKPIREVAITPREMEEEDESEEEKPSGGEKAKRRKRQPAEKPTPRTEAERRIEEIRAEVEKVLDKLGQMEIEG